MKKESTIELNIFQVAWRIALVLGIIILAGIKIVELIF